MRVLITGAAGQVGLALQATSPRDYHITATAHADLDITDGAAVAAIIDRDSIDVVINTAAYTDVERCETEAARAQAINGAGPAMLARACQENRARLIHVSTDYIFDGTKGSPYAPTDAANPLNVYGRTKLEGERNVFDILADRACVVRTSWVHSAQGRNFVVKILQRMQTDSAIRVVDDEIGAPTSAASLAVALWRCVSVGASGIQHWSDAGSVSRFELARAIAKHASKLGLLAAEPRITPVRSADFSTHARRPSYSVLDTHATQTRLNLSPLAWESGVMHTIEEIARLQRVTPP